MARITLPNGTIIEATEAMVARLLKGVEDGVHYNSSTHGRVVIADMATSHIKNAIAKILREYLEYIRTSVSTVEFVTVLKNGLGSDNLTFLALVKELSIRFD